MNKFNRFYEWFSSSIGIFVLMGLLFLSIVFYKAITSQEIGSTDLMVGWVSLTFEYIICFSWLVCTVIYHCINYKE